MHLTAQRRTQSLAAAHAIALPVAAKQGKGAAGMQGLRLVA